jgi:DNA-binding helix-hairpin-helix protein with protein kinase domain
MTRTLVDSRGWAILPGAELGRGGEGIVFDLNGRPHEVAKIYLSQPGPELAAKLGAMSSLASERLSNLAAWPTGLIYDRGKVVGFVMPKVTGFRPAYELYGPKLRLQKFPRADWRFLVHAASNTARAFAAVHEMGQIVGDINHGNLVVGHDATVRHIDCDSFQITASGRTWYCEVGVPTHQPPEMQRLRTYAGFLRTPNHDAFGLAVLIFQLLCLARHPYSGKWLGSGEPPAIEEAIRDYRYAYAADRSRTKIAPPPGSLPIEAIGTQIASLFERAFLPNGSNPGGRPTAAHWVSELDRLAKSLRQCSFNGGHHYLSTLPSCPWCALEGGSGVMLFPATFVTSHAGADGFLLLWQQAEAVKVPPPRPPAEKLPKRAPTREAKTVQWMRSLAVLAFVAASAAAIDVPSGAIAVIAITFALAASVFISSGRKVRTEVKACKAKWVSLVSEWHQAPEMKRLIEARRRAESTKRQYDALVAERNTKLASLHANHRQIQLAQYLDRFRISDAKIKGIGPSKAAILQSYGVETAEDALERKILLVPGFGPATTRKIMDWRRMKEAAFRFDPSKPIPASEKNFIENTFIQRRRSLEAQLSTILRELQSALASEIDARNKFSEQYTEIAPRYAQACANARAALMLV